MPTYTTVSVDIQHVFVRTLDEVVDTQHIPSVFVDIQLVSLYKQLSSDWLNKACCVYNIILV